MEEMEDYGVYIGQALILIVGGREKAEEMKERYAGAEVYEIEKEGREWVRKEKQ